MDNYEERFYYFFHYSTLSKHDKMAKRQELHAY